MAGLLGLKGLKGLEGLLALGELGPREGTHGVGHMLCGGRFNGAGKVVADKA